MMIRLVCSLWLLVAGAAWAAGAPVLSAHNSKAPIAIDADALEVLQAQNKAIFSGNVVAKQADVLLKADKMTVYYSNKSTSSNAISKIEVNGNVYLATPKETARGSYGEYDTVRNFIILSGGVVLTKDKNVLKGSRLEFDINSGRSKLDGASSETGGSGGRVRGLFVPEGQ